MCEENMRRELPWEVIGITNGEYILKNTSIKDISQHIKEKYCEKSNCEECPLHHWCNAIFDELEKKINRKPNGIEVIEYWLNDGKDYIFYSHKEGDKQRICTEYDAHYNFRNSCNMRKKAINSYGLGRIYIASGNQNYKIIGKICEKCFPKLCSALKIDIPNFIEPYFEIPNRKKKYKNSTYCWDCGKSSPRNYNFCPKCGTELDK